MKLYFILLLASLVMSITALVRRPRIEKNINKIGQLKQSIMALWARKTSTRPLHKTLFMLKEEKPSAKYYKLEHFVPNPNYSASFPLVVNGDHTRKMRPWSIAPKVVPSYFVIPVLYHGIPSLQRVFNSSVPSINKVDSNSFTRRKHSFQIPAPLFFLNRSKRFSAESTKQIQPLIKEKEIITYSSYPQCFAISEKIWPLLGITTSNVKKTMKREIGLKGNNHSPSAEVPYWPLLGAVGRVSKSSIKNINGSEVALVTVLDSKKNWQMDLVRKISEMKAKEHFAEENRLSQLHKTQEAKHEFQERIGEQLKLLSEAKRADLQAKEAFKKVVGYERGLAQQDKEIHRLKEGQDELYEELLESEAEVAMADMNIIPKLMSEEELQDFLSGTRFTDQGTRFLKHF